MAAPSRSAIPLLLLCALLPPGGEASEAPHRAGLGGVPQITALSASTLEPSGRLRVLGLDFGPAQGSSQVLIDGQAAIVSRWSDTEIRAYVPESAGPGSVEVRVQNAAGTSGPAALDVVPRARVGQVRWRFTCDSRAIRQRPAVGPDGTVYAQDTDGILYAVSREGALLWLRDLGDQGSEGPVVVGADGTIYAGANPLGPAVEIWALHPDGSVRWVWTEPDGGQGLIAGPGVGPDGHLYAVFDVGGPGAISLDATDGSLRWSHPGSPPFAEFGQLGTEIAFGPDRFFVAFDEVAQSPTSLLYGLDLSGDQLFAVGRPNNNAQPVVGPTGEVVLETWSSSAGIRLGGFGPDGAQLWTAFSSPTNTLTHPDIGPDGSIYVVRNLHELWSLDGNGVTRWMTADPDLLYGPVVSPDGTLILSGGAVLGSHGFFRAFDDVGVPLWTEAIPLDPNGGVVIASTRPIFGADGRAAYVAAEPLSNPDADLHCYLYSLVTAELEELYSDGFESGDLGAWSLSVP
ncbi:MAG TPA: PQQ-binding-like beta-propeller repeat protein [Thermoanaerobaculia bacterium]|nr:PQQ-binding-like beta-propeller repeat protein [Thermoanaerobaculia bacterium]